MAVARAVCGLLLLATVASGQTAVDSSLLSYINGIRAIDSHAHPMRPVAPGAPGESSVNGDVCCAGAPAPASGRGGGVAGAADGVAPAAVAWMGRPQTSQ